MSACKWNGNSKTWEVGTRMYTQESRCRRYQQGCHTHTLQARITLSYRLGRDSYGEHCSCLDLWTPSLQHLVQLHFTLKLSEISVRRNSQTAAFFAKLKHNQVKHFCLSSSTRKRDIQFRLKYMRAGRAEIYILNHRCTDAWGIKFRDPSVGGNENQGLKLYFSYSRKREIRLRGSLLLKFWSIAKFPTSIGRLLPSSIIILICRTPVQITFALRSQSLYTTTLVCCNKFQAEWFLFPDYGNSANRTSQHFNHIFP